MMRVALLFGLRLVIANIKRCPLDIVKAGIQLQHGKKVRKEGYNSVLDYFRKIIRQEGAFCLYRSMAALISMEVPKRSASV
jgi:solute carrier family 25 2-oxodicarboxylate transporter 21